MKLIGVTLRSLICSLYTISENHNLFKTLNLLNDLQLNINNDDCISIEIKNFKVISQLLNKTSLRRHSYSLIKPLLNQNSPLRFDTIEKNGINELFLIKKYLKKYKYHYRRYFFYQNGDYKNLLTDKELNMDAIKSLFLITGI